MTHSLNVQVRQVVKKDSNEVFAMKSLFKKHLIDTNCVENTMAERDILRKVWPVHLYTKSLTRVIGKTPVYRASSLCLPKHQQIVLSDGICEWVCNLVVH